MQFSIHSIISFIGVYDTFMLSFQKHPSKNHTNVHLLFISYMALNRSFFSFPFYCNSPFMVLQELQCGPCDGKSDGASLRLRPDLHHRENHFCLLSPKTGGAEIPTQSEGGGCHAEVQTPGQISGEETEKHHFASRVITVAVVSCLILSLWYFL